MTRLKSRLQGIRVCTDPLVERVIRCHLVERISDHLFRRTPEHFEVAYYNTPLAPMLSDHANAAITSLYAFLCGRNFCKDCRATGWKRKECASMSCGTSTADGLSLRGLDDLKHHRDVVGHPMLFQLKSPGAREFVDSKRHYRDVRPAIVWEIHRSIVDVQIEAGMSAAVINFQVGRRDAAILASNMRLCWRGPAISESDMIKLMEAAWALDRVMFEKHPDGQLPRKTDEELDAIYEREKAAWEKSRRTAPAVRRRRRTTR